MTPLPALPDDRIAEIARAARLWPRVSACDNAEILALVEEITASRALTHGAHADTARLDWLASNCCSVTLRDAYGTETEWDRMHYAVDDQFRAFLDQLATDTAATRSTPGKQV